MLSLGLDTYLLSLCTSCESPPGEYVQVFKHCKATTYTVQHTLSWPPTLTGEMTAVGHTVEGAGHRSRLFTTVERFRYREL